MSQWGQITLWDAAADGDLEMCKKRLANTWTKIDAQDAQGKTALHEACRWGHLDVVTYLIEKGAKPDLVTKEGTTVLHLAALNGHDAVVEYLINNEKVNINAQDKYGDTPLMAASGGGKISTVALLLKLGADRTILNLNRRTAQELASNAHVADQFKERAFMSYTKY